MSTQRYTLSREYLFALVRQAQDCFEESGAPTDPYTLCASHALMLPYEQVGTEARRVFKKAVHAACYDPA